MRQPPRRPPPPRHASSSASRRHDGDTTVVSYTEADKLQDLLRSISDQDPEQTAVDGPPGYEMQMTRYDYGGITLISGPDGPASIAVETATFHGVPVATQEGIAVGSSRTEAMDAGARDGSTRTATVSRTGWISVRWRSPAPSRW
ncbi:hypothetical protein GCM10009862_26550 [Microbacterium binotii]|uniref:Uncharacterized protein n=1 Tax=Microbacterium binotii TaxID=462710 RepID=A0ABN3PHI5_9MICO